ncbi:MAG: cation:proton antiporter [Anaerolineae bacterium]
MNASVPVDTATIFIELGIIVFLLALLARFAVMVGFSPIPFYLVAGLIFGGSGVVPLGFPQQFVQIGAEIGVVLLLFMLGLAYTGEELTSSLRTGLPYGMLNLLFNFVPGLLFGLGLGWEPLAAILLAGATYVSSSGIIAKTLDDLRWLGNRETPTVLSILVIEDLTMAVYLPLVVVLLLGAALMDGVVALSIAISTVMLVLLITVRFGGSISRAITSPSDEVVLLTTLGLILLVAGLAQRLQVSSAVGAFLVGIGLSGPVAERARALLTPLRDLFAATFFLFFSLQIDPQGIPPVLREALLLSVVSLITKFLTGWVAAWRTGIGLRGRFRAGAILTPRGEFSIVIAGLGVSLSQPDLVPLVAAYVLITAVAGSILAKVIDPLVAAVQRAARRWAERLETA